MRIRTTWVSVGLSYSAALDCNPEGGPLIVHIVKKEKMDGHM